MGLKLLYRGRLECYYLPTKFHENLPSGSKVISGTHTHTHTQTDRQTGDFISLLSFLESRLKTLITKRTFIPMPSERKKKR
jgi:hypothetical protein